MIIAQKYRATIQITLSDIFQDFNDSRKQVLMKRVKIALQDLQIRMKNEIQSNNLANLQMLLKKQQAMKKMEEKVSSITQQIEQKRQRDTYLNSKAIQLQSELNKKNQVLHGFQDKIKTLAESIQRLQKQLRQKDEYIEKMSKQKSEIYKQNENIQMQKQKHVETIKKLRDSFIHKVQQTQFILKIKEQKMNQSFNDSLTHLETRHIRERQKQQIQSKLRNRNLQKKNQKIQVNLQQQPPTTSRMSSHQNTSRIKITKEDKQIQTQSTQEKKIIQFIDNTPAKRQEKLQEIRLIYTTPLKQIQQEQIVNQQPKIVKFYAPSISQKSVQTDAVKFESSAPLRFEQTCQAEDSDFSAIFKELQELKIKYERMEQFHENRYWEVVKIYEERPSQQSDLKQINDLKLKILSLELQMEKRENDMSNERKMFQKMNHELQKSQNDILLKRINVKLEEHVVNRNVKPFRPVHPSKSVVISSPNRVYTQISDSNGQQNQEESMEFMRATYYTSKFKKQTQDDIITVIRSKNTLKCSEIRRNSLHSSTVFSQVRPKKSINQYKKYSKLRNNYNE